MSSNTLQVKPIMKIEKMHQLSKPESQAVNRDNSMKSFRKRGSNHRKIIIKKSSLLLSGCTGDKVLSLKKKKIIAKSGGVILKEKKVILVL